MNRGTKHQLLVDRAVAQDLSSPFTLVLQLLSPPLVFPASHVLLHSVLPDVAISLYSYSYHYGLLPLLVDHYYVRLVCHHQFSVCMSLEFSWGAVIQLHFVAHAGPWKIALQICPLRRRSPGPLGLVSLSSIN